MRLYDDGRNFDKEKVFDKYNNEKNMRRYAR